MKKINLNTELINLQGKVITKTEFIKGQKSISVPKTIKSVFIDCLTSSGRHTSKIIKEEGKKIEVKNLKLEIYELAEKIQSSDSIEFSKTEIEIIKKSIINLPVIEYGQLIKLL